MYVRKNQGMRLFIFVCVFMSGLYLQAEAKQKARIIKPLKYTYSAAPSYDTHSDLKFTKLTDGNKTKYIAWRFRDFAHKPLDINYIFDTPIRLEGENSLFSSTRLRG